MNPALDASAAAVVRQIIRDKRIQLALPPQTWLGVLQELAQTDAARDASRPRWGCAIALAIIAGIVSAGCQEWRGAAVLGVLAVLAIVRYVTLRRQDLGNDFRTFLVPVLDALRDDFRTGRPLQLQLDVRGPCSDKITRRGDIKPLNRSPRTRSVQRTVYTDPWCQLDGQLENGHRLRLSIATRYVCDTRHYTSVSGKSKSKTKWRKTVSVRTALAPAEGSTFDRERVQRLHAAGQWRGPQAGRRFGCLARKFKFKNDQEAVPAPKEAVAMLFALCASVVPAGETPHGTQS